jgi:general secretion pathway protein E
LAILYQRYDQKVASLPYAFAKKHGVLLTAKLDNSGIIQFYQLPKLAILLEIKRFFGGELQFEQISFETFQGLLSQHYEANSTSALQMVEGIEDDLDLSNLLEHIPKPEDLLDNQDDAPIIKLLNALLSQSIKQQASDIHIETFEKQVVIRFRMDGILREIATVPRILSTLLISRIKVMAKLDIAEKRLPQDGRLTLTIGGHTVDVRVSTMPANHGERVVLRLLDKKVARLDLTHLGMSEISLSTIENLLKIPHGIILVTGPTGSGKTTTLYAMLTALNNASRNILTIEDPIEYDLPGIGQMQVNSKVNMTFAKGLRAILRQDPDIVMIGEIRDLETAQIAVQASLTGHLVLATLHTNSAIGAITRLRDMGIEPFLLSSSLIGVVGQRLVRLRCRVCDSEQGCEACHDSGYQGRSGIYEVIPCDSTIQKFIHQNAEEATIEQYARTLSPSMREDGLARVEKGQTTREEVLRVTSH